MTSTAVADAPTRRDGIVAARALVLRVGWWLLPATVMAGFGWALLARRHGLWYDELYTAEVAPLPLADLARAVVRGEGTIPYLRDAPPSYNAPYYAVAHLWLAVTGLAPDEVGLRLLSLIGAVGGVTAATLGVGRLAGRRVAVLFGLVVATNPFVVEYAVEARGYALALLAAGLLLLALARWLDGCRRAAPLVGLAAAGLGLAHWFGLLVVAAVGVAALLLGRADPFGRLSPRRSAPTEPATPGPLDPTQRTTTGPRGPTERTTPGPRGPTEVTTPGRRDTTERTTLGPSAPPERTALGPSGSTPPSIPGLVAALAVGSLPALALVATAVANGVGGSGAEWIADVGGAVPRLLLRSWSGSSTWLLVLTVLLASSGLVLGRGRARVVGAVWFGLPGGVVALVALGRPVYVDRYLLPALLGLALLVALGVATLRPRWVGFAAATAVVVASVVASGHAGGLGPKEDVRGAVDAIAAAHVPGQPVVAAARWDALGLDHRTRSHHRALVADVVLPPVSVPDGAETVWVVRRDEGGVKGDAAKLAGLDRDLAARGLHLAEERRFPGRYSATLVQRWTARP